MSMCLIFISGCAKRQIVIRETLAVHQSLPVIVPGVPGQYHIIRRGETLWRISKIYHVNLTKLVKFNEISNVAKIEIGDKIFIPDSLRKSQKPNKKIRSALEFVWPCKGKIIAYFGQDKQKVKNEGIDISANKGSSVYAVAAGKVIFTSANMRGYGKVVIIRHNSQFTSVYAYNRENLVKTGDFIKQGQVIAQVGDTGRTGQCVLHFQLRKNFKPQNPLLYLS